ncbi:MAG: hypothetical protein NTV31_12315, partial [Bacteroidia bacterium]|nr:hypothetical protein [Bacteroidia bacterium]
MIKKLKPAILLLIFFLFLQSAYGQLQKNMTDYLMQRFLRYSEAVPREEIFVHSDREDYIAGEDMWFCIYLIDRQSFKPSLNNKIAYFELLNAENRPVVQKRIGLDGGFGPGQIVLPDTLSTGTYTIRAYTSWMKNFLPENCFMKDIRIYNALSKKAFIEKSYSDKLFKRETGSDIIPETNEVGLTLKVNNLKSDTLEIFVNADKKYRFDNKNIFYLFIQTHGVINYISTEIMPSENIKISIPKKVLIPGINHITIFGSKGQPLRERFIYTPEKNNQSLMVNSSGTCKKRNKISLDLAFENELVKPLNSANLSISVSPATDQAWNMELTDYMIFGSEFGLLPQNAIKGRKIDEFPPDKLDSLLLTIKSNWIEWGKILSDSLPVFKYQVEKEDHYLLGKLLTTNRKPADPGAFLLLSTPGKVAVFNYARTDNEGNFKFNIHIDEELKDLIIQPDEVTKNQTINIESSFSDQYIKSEISVDSTNKPLPQYISRWGINY